MSEKLIESILLFIFSFVTEMLTLRLVYVLLHKRIPHLNWTVRAGIIFECTLIAILMVWWLVWMPGK